MLLSLLVAAVTASQWSFNKFKIADGKSHTISLGEGVMDVNYVYITFSYPAFGCSGHTSFKFKFMDSSYSTVYTGSASLSSKSVYPSSGSVGEASYLTITNQNSACDVNVWGHVVHSPHQHLLPEPPLLAV